MSNMKTTVEKAMTFLSVLGSILFVVGAIFANRAGCVIFSCLYVRRRNSAEKINEFCLISGELKICEKGPPQQQVGTKGLRVTETKQYKGLFTIYCFNYHCGLSKDDLIVLKDTTYVLPSSSGHTVSYEQGTVRAIDTSINHSPGTAIKAFHSAHTLGPRNGHQILCSEM